MSKKAKLWFFLVHLSQNHILAVTTRDELTPNGKHVTGRQLEVPTPCGENSAFHHIAFLEASQLERIQFNAQDIQANRNAMGKAKNNNLGLFEMTYLLPDIYQLLCDER